ncbi:serine/threonine-protein kinase [Microcoleus sp. FACHB-68]|uniref:serine/threonine-protein kinase n=1 Tax=Microcoleus sp. FACHB-68 TaxID=2692826 RepID=UPI001685D606|nr:serine/threonine-protein kinase [Microcoleus sp. FACHB-68]MBD1935785.1 tetratricopeptide repeat protein [Microcoleus sp. FACHB-68]
MDTFLLGQILAGRYKIVSFLGGGAFGQTYIAQDLQLPDYPRCVVKQLKPQTTDPLTLETARRLFDTEAKVLHQLGRHDQIPRLLAHFEEQQEFYLVQDCIEGEPLNQEIKAGKRLSEAEVIVLLRDVLSTLAFVHRQNVIHRDIKPSNLIRRNSDGKIVLIDFGAVKQVSTQAGDESFTVAIGTPGYMPNEQLGGQPRPNSDIYALGAIAIQALTGILPSRLRQDAQTGELIWQNDVQVSDRLAAIIDKMVRYHFKDRYQTAEEALADLEDLENYAMASTIASYSKPAAPIDAPRMPTGETLPQPSATVHSTPPLPRSKKLWYILIPGLIAGLIVGFFKFFPTTDYLAQANQFLDTQQPEEAISTIDKSLITNPNQAKAWKIRGDALFLLERYEAALAAYEKASQIDPKDPKAWNNQGETLYLLQRYEEALKAHDKALELSANNIEAVNGRGIALLGLKRYQDALSAFEKALQIQPNHPKSWENRALALEYLQRPQESRKAFEEALASYNDTIKLNPNDLQTLINRGRVLGKLQRPTEALASYDSAIKINPNFFPAWVGKGSTLFFAQKPEEALKAYDKALEIRPKSYLSRHNRGSLLAAMQRPEDAIKDYDKAIEIQNNFYPALRDRGFALLQLQRTQDAIASFDKAIKYESKDHKSWVGRGIALKELKRNEQALAALDKAISIEPNDPVALLHRGLTLEEMQRNEDALNAYNQAIAADATFAPAIEARSKLQQKLGL